MKAVPPWLTSAIVHMAVILLLALLHVARAGSPLGITIDLMDAGGGSLSELDAADFDSSLPADPEPLATAVAFNTEQMMPLELPTPLAAIELPDLSKLRRAIEPALPDRGAAGKGAEGTGIGVGEGSGEGPGIGRTSVFGLEAEGRTFVYVFDRSESMGYVYYSEEDTRRFGIPLQAAKDELLASISDLTNRQQFQVVFYNHQPELFRTGRRPGAPALATRDNKGKAMDFVYAIRAAGGTNHMNALDVAVKMKPDVIFLLTDGLAEDDPTLVDLRQIEQLNRGTASINVIQFAEAPRPESTLIQLASENRGRYLFVNITQAGEQARKIGKQLRKSIDTELDKAH